MRVTGEIMQGIAAEYGFVCNRSVFTEEISVFGSRAIPYTIAGCGIDAGFPVSVVSFQPGNSKTSLSLRFCFEQKILCQILPWPRIHQAIFRIQSPAKGGD